MNFINQTHPKPSYAEKVKSASTPASYSLDEITAAQLVRLLKSCGLSVVATGAAAQQVPSPPSNVTVYEAQMPRTDQNASLPAPSGDAGDGWTLVRRRRHSPQTQAAGASIQPRPYTAVDEALRRGEEERRARF